MMKRFIDKPSGTFSRYFYGKQKLEVCVVCPKCQKMGIVTEQDDCYSFKCQHCFEKKIGRRFVHAHKIEEYCSYCERMFRLDIPQEKKHFTVLNVNCPYCETMTPAKLQKLNVGHYEPLAFDYPLYFLDYLDGKQIWALNREHLQYLIDYIEAELRERGVVTNPHTGEKFTVMRGESYRLPKFMKLAKNRDKVLKILRRLQAK